MYQIQKKPSSHTARLGAAKFIAYSPYGYTPLHSHHWLNIAGFNGEHFDTDSNAYLLGSYRLYAPSIMRFRSPDNLSPFAAGGINAYVYCSGQPITRKDTNGHFWRNFTSGRNQRNTSSRTFAQGGTSVWHADLTRYPTLQNTLEKALPQELARFQEKFNKGWLSSFAVDRNSKHRLKTIDWSDRFVFMDPPEMLVATGHTQMAATTHAALASQGNNTRIISAGTIRSLGGNRVEITNKSGHYRPPFNRLIPVENYLSELGFEVYKTRAF